MKYSSSKFRILRNEEATIEPLLSCPCSTSIPVVHVLIVNCKRRGIGWGKLGGHETPNSVQVPALEGGWSSEVKTADAPPGTLPFYGFFRVFRSTQTINLTPPAKSWETRSSAGVELHTEIEIPLPVMYARKTPAGQVK